MPPAATSNQTSLATSQRTLLPNTAVAAPPVDARQPACRLVGIARLAAQAPPLGTRAGTVYHQLAVRSLINRCDSARVPFRWTINPYRGCEFGCRYCYARYTHEYLERPPEEFEKKIYVKANAAERLVADLARLPLHGEHIALGTATDPYQPAEARFRITRQILHVFAKRRGLSVSITTKSNRIVRDLDLLVEIAAHSELTVNMTVTTLDARLARLLEPRAPRPDLRLAAVARLRQAGLAVGVFSMPLLPWITDGEEPLDALAQAAADHGAQWWVAGPVFLMPASRGIFLRFVAQHFPQLVPRYRQWFEDSGYAPAHYRKELALRIERIRQRYRLPAGPPPPAHPYAPIQMSLPFSGTTATHDHQPPTALANLREHANI